LIDKIGGQYWIEGYLMDKSKEEIIFVGDKVVFG